MAAFTELLGVDGGRYSVGAPSDSVRANLDGELEAAIRAGARHINELVSVVVGGSAMRIARIELRPDAVESYVRAAPERVRTIVAALGRERTPRELVLEGSTSLLELERILLDLIKRGGVAAIEAPPPERPVPPPTTDELRWERLRHDEGEPMPPPPSPIRSPATPSVVPAEPDLLPRPGREAGDRISLAPMTVTSVRPAPKQFRLAWIVVIAGFLVSIALWAKIFTNMKERRTRRRQAEATEIAPEPPRASEDIGAAPPEEPLPRGEPLPQPEEPRPRVQPAPPPEPAPPSRVEAPPIEPPPERVAPPPAPDVRPPPAAEVNPPPEHPAAEPRAPPAPRPPVAPPTKQAAGGRPGAGTLNVIGAAGVEVIVDGTHRGVSPLTLEVSGGLHEVRLRHGEQSILRYAFVPGGETRRLIVPSME